MINYTIHCTHRKLKRYTVHILFSCENFNEFGGFFFALFLSFFQKVSRFEFFFAENILSYFYEYIVFEKSKKSFTNLLGDQQIFDAKFFFCSLPSLDQKVLRTAFFLS